MNFISASSSITNSTRNVFGLWYHRVIAIVLIFYNAKTIAEYFNKLVLALKSSTVKKCAIYEDESINLQSQIEKIFAAVDYLCIASISLSTLIGFALFWGLFYIICALIEIAYDVIATKIIFSNSAVKSVFNSFFSIKQFLFLVPVVLLSGIILVMIVNYLTLDSVAMNELYENSHRLASFLSSTQDEKQSFLNELCKKEELSELLIKEFNKYKNTAICGSIISFLLIILYKYASYKKILLFSNKEVEILTEENLHQQNIKIINEQKKEILLLKEKEKEKEKKEIKNE